MAPNCSQELPRPPKQAGARWARCRQPALGPFFVPVGLSVQEDGSYVVQWYNCASGRATVKGAYKPSWFDAKSGKEIFDDKEHSMPTWNLQSRASVVSLPFQWNESKTGRRLPAEVAVRMFEKVKG